MKKSESFPVNISDVETLGWQVESFGPGSYFPYEIVFQRQDQRVVMPGNSCWEAVDNFRCYLKRQGVWETPNSASPDDLRAKGWMVAVHNDYRLGAELYTFWLFTKDHRCVKGEGRTDAEALNQVRALLDVPPEPYGQTGNTPVVDTVTKIAMPVYRGPA